MPYKAPQKPAVLLYICLAALAASAQSLEITAEADLLTIPAGGSVELRVSVRRPDGNPGADVRLLPYVNGCRWGAHEVTDETGQALFLLPLPNTGDARIQVQAVDGHGGATHWIWSPVCEDKQHVWLEKPFSLEGEVYRATLRFAVDDACELFLNAQAIGRGSGWHDAYELTGLEKHLRKGENILRAKTLNATGPAGFAAQLDLHTGRGLVRIHTDSSWTAQRVGEGAPVSARSVGRIEESSSWTGPANEWPGVPSKNLLLAGTPMPKDAVLSNAVTVTVRPRRFAVHEDPEHLIGMQWEPWFTPLNAYWQTAQAVPLVGFYDSTNLDVIRQHAYWLMDAGINFIFVDWSNHIWGKKHWSERDAGVEEIIHATTVTLDAYAAMRDEGLPVPKVVIMPGLSNGPPATMEALNEEHAWIYEHYVQNPRYKGLFLEYEGKPLIVPLDCGHMAVRQETPPVDDRHFTIRWMGTQFQINHGERHGYWSWMDGCLRPVVTYHKNKAEVVTPTPAYFAENGWLGPKARGRRGGTTYIESFKAALEHRPRFVLLHQWNEYAGQPEGHGHGPNHDRYVDSYSVEFSDDLEPVSLTADGYRKDTGGWGFYYLNLTRALVRLFHQKIPQDTILAVHPPERGGEVTQDYIALEWAVAGKAPSGYTVLLDGKPIIVSYPGTTYCLDLKRVANGAHTVTVLGQNAMTHFPLSHTRADAPLDTPIPAKVDVPFVLKR